MHVAKVEALRTKLDVGEPANAMAAHNPLAANERPKRDFDAARGSGFELSASFAVPDGNILPISIHLKIMREG